MQRPQMTDKEKNVFAMTHYIDESIRELKRTRKIVTDRSEEQGIIILFNMRVLSDNIHATIMKTLNALSREGKGVSTDDLKSIVVSIAGTQFDKLFGEVVPVKLSEEQVEELAKTECEDQN